MAAKDIVATVERLISPVFENSVYTLTDLEFVKEGPHWYLRIYADKEGGITIEDCEIISKNAERLLDEKDPIEQAYILEVSSPGIDRPLKNEADFIKYNGEIIDIKLYKAVDKVKDFQGKLISFENNIVSIEEENERILRFDRSEIASCRLAVVF